MTNSTEFYWLLKTLATLRPGAQWAFREEPSRGAMGCIVCMDQLTGLECALPFNAWSQEDPISVLDALYCCSCGASVMVKAGEIGSHNSWTMPDPMKPIAHRARSLCARCATQISANKCDHMIASRDQVLGIAPGAVLWQLGSHGVQMGMSAVLGGIHCPPPLSFDEITNAAKNGTLPAFSGGDTCPITLTSTEQKQNEQRRKAKQARESAHRKFWLAELSKKVEMKP